METQLTSKIMIIAEGKTADGKARTFLRKLELINPDGTPYFDLGGYSCDRYEVGTTSYGFKCYRSLKTATKKFNELNTMFAPWHK